MAPGATSTSPPRASASCASALTLTVLPACTTLLSAGALIDNGSFNYVGGTINGTAHIVSGVMGADFVPPYWPNAHMLRPLDMPTQVATRPRQALDLACGADLAPGRVIQVLQSARLVASNRLQMGVGIGQRGQPVVHVATDQVHHLHP